MAFSIAGGLKNIHRYGVNHMHYKNASREIIAKVLDLRGKKVIDYQAEALAIKALKDIESIKDSATTRTASDLGSKAVKICAGPAAGIATKMIGTVAYKQQAGGDIQDSIAESAMEVVESQVTKTVYQEASNWFMETAADWFGLGAGTLAVAAAPVAVGAVAIAGVAACAVSEKARNTCLDVLGNTVNGVKGLLSEAAGLALPAGGNVKILAAYKVWNQKKKKFLIKEVKLKENASLLKKDTETLKGTIAMQNSDVEGNKNAISKEQKVLDDHKNLLDGNKDSYDVFKMAIKERTEKGLGCFVKFFKHSECLNHLFSFISKSFKREKIIQDDLRSKKNDFKIEVGNQTKNVQLINSSVARLNADGLRFEAKVMQSMGQLKELEEKINLINQSIIKKKASVDLLERSYLDSLIF